MKKTLLIILSLILCISMLTGCAGQLLEELGDAVNDDADETKASDTEKEDIKVDTANMQVAIDSFNKIDLSAFAEVPTDYLDTIKKLVNEISFALTLNATGNFGEDGEVDLDVRMKDGKLYFKALGQGEGEDDGGEIEAFLSLSENAFDTYANFDGEGWQKHTQDLTEITNELAGMYDPNMITDIIGDVVIPKLEEKYLSKKNDMLLLSNDYIIDLVVANIPVFSELTGMEEMTDEEIEEFKKDGKEFFEEYGIAIYLGTGVDTITKLAVEMADEETSVYGEIALTADASALDNFTLKIKTELGEGDIKYAPETVITAKSVYDAEGNAVGLDVDGTVYIDVMTHYDYEETGENEEKYIRESIIQKATIDAILDFGAIGKTNADIFNLDVDVEAVKVIKAETLQNWETGEETILSVKEGDVSKYNDSKFSLLINLKSENENKANLKFEAKEGDYEITAKGSISFVDKKLSVDFELAEDGEKLFNFDAFIKETAADTFEFGTNVVVTDEGHLSVTGELYMGADVVLPTFPTEYEEVEDNPLFGGSESETYPEEIYPDDEYTEGEWEEDWYEEAIPPMPAE